MIKFQKYLVVPIVATSAFTGLCTVFAGFWSGSPPRWLAWLAVASITYALIGAIGSTFQRQPDVPYLCYSRKQAICDAVYFAAIAWLAILITHDHLFEKL